MTGPGFASGDFVKSDIDMAVFRTNGISTPEMPSQITRDVINNMSNDPLVESVNNNSYLLAGKDLTNGTPVIHGLEYFNQNGWKYIPNKVSITFWRLPPSIDEFGSTNGGTLDNWTNAESLSYQVAIYDADNVSDFIQRASSNPYVSNIELLEDTQTV